MQNHGRVFLGEIILTSPQKPNEHFIRTWRNLHLLVAKKQSMLQTMTRRDHAHFTTTTGGYFAIHISSQTTKKEVSESLPLQTIIPRKILSFCDTKTSTPVQSQVLHNSRTWHNCKTFPIITASRYCVRLTLHRKLFVTNRSPQRLSESTEKSIGFRYKIYHKPLVAFWESQQVCVRSYIENR